MATHKILAEETVPVSELRKNPSEYFTDRPIAVMNHNRATGYTLGVELFEQMMAIIEHSEEGKTIRGQFRPTAERLKEIAAASAAFHKNATEEQLGSFSE